jgi:hypothetical protein
MPAHLGAENAEAVLGIVVGDALDKTRQNFPARRFGLRPHVGVIYQSILSPDSRNIIAFLGARRAAFPVASLKRWRGRLSVANRRCPTSVEVPHLSGLPNNTKNTNICPLSRRVHYFASMLQSRCSRCKTVNRPDSWRHRCASAISLRYKVLGR